MTLHLKDIVLPLADFDLTVNERLDNRTSALIGPSGAGKTSLLEVICGLRTPRTGEVWLGDIHLDLLPTRERRIGYVPQDLALFPHRTARQNILYGLPRRESDPIFSFSHVAEVLELQPLLDRGVGSLSGGERQRVALARALVSSPRLLLLDEPLASLDTDLKARILPYLQRLRTEFPLPIMYVTHDLAEATALCDEIVELQRGKVIRRHRLYDKEQNEN